MLNALSIDIEDYFHVTAFEKYVKREDWDKYDGRIRGNTLKILDILDSFSVKATFFVLGWVAEKDPLLIKEIQRRGHEIACHGYDHRLIYHMSPQEFREDIKKSKKILEEICLQKVIGYRAPSYSIIKKSYWALDILVEEGFIYDSSIFPILHDTYGIPQANRFPHEIITTRGTLKEFPISTAKVGLGYFKCNIPIAGGGYLRFLPLGFIKKAINNINAIEKQPVVMYFHPWEIDPKQPKIKAGLKAAFRHYYNLAKAEDKIKSILSSFKFDTLKKILRIDDLKQCP